MGGGDWSSVVCSSDLATTADLNGPVDVVLGPDCSLYIADRINYRVRRGGLDGIITTLAGGGQPGFRGDGKERKSGAWGKRGDLGGGRVIKKKKRHNHN